jgi:hypothetical protein
MVNGMADGKISELGREGVAVCPIPWAFTPVLKERGVLVERRCHLFFSDNVGGKHPWKLK